VVFVGACLAGAPLAAQSRFVRGDVEPDGQLKITDPVRTLGFLFLGNPARA
jgi:hypothetical protein